MDGAKSPLAYHRTDGKFAANVHQNAGRAQFSNPFVLTHFRVCKKVMTLVARAQLEAVEFALLTVRHDVGEVDFAHA